MCWFTPPVSGRPLVRSGGIVLAERLRTFQALSAIARGASGFVIEGDVPEEGTVAEIVRVAGLPLLKQVTASSRGSTPTT